MFIITTSRNRLRPRSRSLWPNISYGKELHMFSLLILTILNVHVHGLSLLASGRNTFENPIRPNQIQSELLCPNPIWNLLTARNLLTRTLHHISYKPCLFGTIESRNERNHFGEFVEVRAIFSDQNKLDFNDSNKCEQFYVFESLRSSNAFAQPYFICKSLPNLYLTTTCELISGFPLNYLGRKLKKLQNEFDDSEAYFDMWELQGKLKFFTNYGRSWEKGGFLQLIFIIYRDYSCSHIRIQQYEVQSSCNSTQIEDLQINGQICGIYNCTEENGILNRIGFYPDKNPGFPFKQTTFLSRVSILISNITSLFLFVLVAIVLKSFVIRYISNRPYPRRDRDLSLDRSETFNRSNRSTRSGRSARSISPNVPNSIIRTGHQDNLPVDPEPPPPYESVQPPSYLEATDTSKTQNNTNT